MKISKPLKNKESYWILGKHSVFSAIKNKERIINKIIVSDLKNKIFLNEIKKELTLNNKKVKSLLIEINENFAEQHDNILNLMNKYEFKFLHKGNNEDMNAKQNDSKKTCNYIFIKN